MRFHQSAASVLAFTDSRKTGVTYHYFRSGWYAAAGVYTNNDINRIGTDQQLNTGAVTCRLARRFLYPVSSGILHVGGAFSFIPSEVNTDNSVREVKSNGVTSMLGEPMLYVELDRVTTECKGVVEFLYTDSSFLVQSEYFVNRFGHLGGPEKSLFHGGYLQGSYLLKGKGGFEYDMEKAVPGRPVSSRSVELTARINYTDMSCGHHPVGGRELDFSVGLNYYINRFFGIKWNFSYVLAGQLDSSFYRKNLFITQLRCQYIF